MWRQEFSSPCKIDSGARRLLRWAWEAFKVVAIAALIILPVRYFLFQPFVVRGASMEPNFHSGEYLIVDEISYRLREPAVGDVVVFRSPADSSQYYIKRIIAVPGDTVRIKESRIIVRNNRFPQGVIVDESAYLPPAEKTVGEVEVTLGPDQYFVLGDNRDASSDSRRWGPLPRKNIIGRAWVRLMPLSRLGTIRTPLIGFLNLDSVEAP